MEGAEYNRHSRARVAETAKDASRHATPDAPEYIDHRRRCTRHDHRTCCRGSRGSASLPCHALRKTRRNVPLHQGFFAEMQSIYGRTTPVARERDPTDHMRAAARPSRATPAARVTKALTRSTTVSGSA